MLSPKYTMSYQGRRKSRRGEGGVTSIAGRESKIVCVDIELIYQIDPVQLITSGSA
jgi:hypothetical protein